LSAGPHYVRRSQLSCTGPPQIGFDFAAPGEDTLDAAWEERREELRLVAAANGGKAHAKHSDPERKHLAAWCTKQARRSAQSHIETLIIYKLAFNQDYYTFVLILPVKILPYGKFH
jgi:hypothetical protein